MGNDIDRAAAEALRQYAISIRHYDFAELVDTALDGAEWAKNRVASALWLIAHNGNTDACRRHYVTLTNCSRPSDEE